MVPILFQCISILSMCFSLKARIGIFEVTIFNQTQLHDFEKLASNFSWDIWNRPVVGRPVRFLSGSDRDNINYLKRRLAQAGLNVKVVNENLDRTIYDEVKQNAAQRRKMLLRKEVGKGIETYFASHKEYNQWLQRLKVENPKLVSLKIIGKTYEGRNMIILKISTGSNKRSIFLEGGIHAREWLAVSSVVWILNKIIVRQNKNDTIIMEVLNDFDVYFLPVANPDGYEMSRRGGTYRLWRKNTMPVGDGCYGIDLNRNFDSDFGGSDSSSDPCDLTYPGVGPFTAPETKNFRNFLLSIKDDLKLFISFHAYSQLLLTPWGYTKTPPSDNEELMRVANIMVDAIYNSSGVKYEVGSPANILYAASGGCYDWVKQIGIPYSYTFEVRPNSDSVNGFLAPVKLIRPTGEELYDAVIAAAKAVK